MATFLALLALPGCGEAPAARGVPDDSTYVQVMARLSYIRQTARRSRAADTLRWADSARLRVLETYGVDAEKLERYAVVHGDDPKRMEEIWARIGDALDHIVVRAARSSPLLDLGPEASRPPSASAEEAGDEPGSDGPPDGAGDAAEPAPGDRPEPGDSAGAGAGGAA